MQLMALGMFVFSVATLAPYRLDRRADWQHARASRVGVRDATQYTGPGEESITLSGTVYAEITDGDVSLDALHDMAYSGESWPLVDGRGFVHGDYVLTAIDERQRAFRPDGSARRIDFTIHLLRTA